MSHLKFGTHTSSDENSGCESSSGQGMEEARNDSSLALGQSEEQNEVILKAQRDKNNVHFVTLMDICHLKNAELDPKFRKYKGRIVLRGDIVKDGSGAHAVFTGQGSSASQMSAAKIARF